MKKNKLDKVIMLLSTDWFFSDWSMIGIVMDDKRKTMLQKGCREIVREMMSGATEYWLISFSAKRIQETLSRFELLLERSKVEGAAFKRISALTRESNSSEPDSGLKWLLTHITRMMLQSSPKIEQPLDPEIKQIVETSYDESRLDEVDGIDFEALSLESTSQWDGYIRSVTPDSPTFLSDYLRAEIIGQDRFEIIWSVIEGKLSPQQRKEIMNWYRSTARSLTGDEVTFPHIN